MLALTTVDHKTDVNMFAGLLADSYSYTKVVKYTTKKPKPCETDGKNYWFISPKQFKNLETANKLICVQSSHVKSQKLKTPDKIGISKASLELNLNSVLTCYPEMIDELSNYCCTHNVLLYVMCIVTDQNEAQQYITLLRRMNYVYNIDNNTELTVSNINYLYKDWLKYQDF